MSTSHSSLRTITPMKNNACMTRSKRVVLHLLAVGAVLLLASVAAGAQVSFFAPPTYAGGGTPFVADFNGDGKPDILAADGTLNLGKGDGTFTTGTPVAGGALAVADFNGDGKPDVLQQGTGTLLVLLGNGDGTFQKPVTTNTGMGTLYAVTAGGLRDDGRFDVVGIVYNVNNYYLVLFLGNGDGTFASGMPYALPPSSSGFLSFLILGDVNGDGKTDVTVITPGSPGQVIVFLGNGDGTLQAPRTSTGVIPSGNFPGLAVEGDFNSDGKVDLAISAVSCAGQCVASPIVSLILGNGDGTFQSPTTVISGNGSLAASDLNGDGRLDLVMESDTVAQIFLGNGDGTFSNASNYVLSLPGYPGVINPSYLAVADFNLDGKLDVAAGNAILLGNGKGTFQGIPLGVVPTTPYVEAVGDFENNSTMDVAALDTGNGQAPTNLYILSNNGAGSLSLIHTYPLQQGLQYASIATADLRGGGKLDLVVLYGPFSGWGYAVLLGNGDGSFQSPVYYTQSVMANPANVVVADFKNDHKPDLAVGFPGSNQEPAVLLGNGDGTFAAPVYYFAGGGGGLVTADFNGDGKLDLAVGGTAGAGANGTVLLFGNGDGTFQNATFPTNLNSFAAQFTPDLRDVGKSDLLSSNQVALGNGDGTFNVLAPFCAVSNSCLGVNAVADLNGDGKPDVIFTEGFDHPEGSAVWLGNGDGTFGVSYGLYGLFPSAVLVADMNGDGRPDIVFLTGGGVGVLLNTTMPGFELSATALSPATVVAGNSATSTVAVKPTFGFSNTVTLSCKGLPSGASCSFNPPSIGKGSGTSSLTVSTTTSTAAGTYPVQVQGSAGSVVNSATVSLVVQAAPDFAIGPASGSPTSQSISAGQSAKFDLTVTPAGSFSGTVSLSCSISPSVTPAPTCSVPSSVNVTAGTAAPFTVTVGTTPPVTTGTVTGVDFPTGWMPLVWTGMLLSSGWLLLRNRRRRPILATPLVVLALALWVGCGGGSGSSSHTTPGTPAGTYTATVTATSGSLNHNTALTVIVQ